jgi:hypothetical protein
MSNAKPCGVGRDSRTSHITFAKSLTRKRMCASDLRGMLDEEVSQDLDLQLIRAPVR